MELVIIRHWEVEADLLGVHEGRADFPLTEKGIAQTRKMGGYVAEHFPPETILTSPLQRAKKTALILKEKTGSPLVEVSDLRKVNNRVLAGIDKKEAVFRYPLPEGGRPIHIPIQDGESQLEFRYRAEEMY